jgi:hypothetical protein
LENWERQEKEKGAKKKERKKGDDIQTAELDRRDQVTAPNSWPNFRGLSLRLADPSGSIHF